MSGYAVFDFETTGRLPRRDRAVEIGLVLLSSNLEVEHEFETLINPQRDVSAQEIHGIRTAWVLDAPVFAELAFELSNFMENRTLVAHNAAFDLQVLESEYVRLDSTFAFEWISEERRASGSLCTKSLSREVFGVEAQSLAWLCSQFGIDNSEQHRALSDARATAQAFVELMKSSDRVISRASAAGIHRSPELPRAKVRPVVRPLAEAGQVSAMDRLIGQLPPIGSDTQISEYVTSLLIHLRDSHLSRAEIDALADLAGEIGLSREAAKLANDMAFDYIKNLFWQDGTLTDFEKSFLESASRALGLRDAEFTRPSDYSSSSQRDETMSVSGAKTFLFTGFSSSLEEELQQSLKKLGHTVSPGFSKKVDFVIAFDPDSQSGKAVQARKSGVPVLGREFVEFLASRKSLDNS